MQACLLVAPQAPATTRPQQATQPMAAGAARPSVAMPQFDAAIAKAMLDKGPANPAAAQAALSDVIDQSVSAPGSSTLRPDSPADAEPAKRSVSITSSQTEVVVRPGSSPQSSSKRVAPPAIPASRSGPAALPVIRGQVVAAGLPATISTSVVAGVDEPADGGQQPSTGSGLTKTGPESGDASAPLDEGASVAERSGLSADAEHVLSPGPQPSTEASQKAPQEDHAAAHEPESAATRSSVEDASRAIAKTADSKPSRTSPRSDRRNRPIRWHGCRHRHRSNSPPSVRYKVSQPPHRRSTAVNRRRQELQTAHRHRPFRPSRMSLGRLTRTRLRRPVQRRHVRYPHHHRHRRTAHRQR